METNATTQQQAITINARLNPRAAQVCAEHGLSLTGPGYYVASHCPWDRPDTHVMLGFTDDPAEAFEVKDKLTPAVPGETFSVQVWR